MLIQNNPHALSLFLTEPVYLVKEKKAHGEEAKALEENPAELGEKAISPQPINYEGKNLKKVLLLYKGTGSRIPEAQYTFLGNILKAVNLDFEDVALVNTHLLTAEQYPLLNEFDAKVWLSFGVAHDAWPIQENAVQYKIIKTKNASLLLAHSLNEIEANRDKKVLLWNNLKSLFGI